jgi:hypothetical protein
MVSLSNSKRKLDDPVAQHMDPFSLVLTPVKSQWTIPLNNNINIHHNKYLINAF